jgi:hypothetical protein
MLQFLPPNTQLHRLYLLDYQIETPIHQLLVGNMDDSVLLDGF